MIIRAGLTKLYDVRRENGDLVARSLSMKQARSYVAHQIEGARYVYKGGTNEKVT